MSEPGPNNSYSRDTACFHDGSASLRRNFFEKNASNLFYLYSRSSLMRQGEYIEAKLTINDLSRAECLLCVVSMSRENVSVNGIELRCFRREV